MDIAILPGYLSILDYSFSCSQPLPINASVLVSEIPVPRSCVLKPKSGVNLTAFHGHIVKQVREQYIAAGM